MIIEINDKIKLSAISDLFTQYYPFLKIAFYSQPHQWQEASTVKNLLSHDLSVGEVSSLHFSGMIEIHFWQKTGTVEQEFRRLAGLNIQILRRNGNDWIETTGTDELTLEEQNEVGMKATEDILHGTNRFFEREKFT